MKPYDTSTTPGPVKEIQWMQFCDNDIVAPLAALRQTWPTRTNQTSETRVPSRGVSHIQLLVCEEDSTLGINISDHM